MKKQNLPIDLIIVGGGIQGMYLFHVIKQKREDLNIKIVDPHSAPLHSWRHCTENTGMKFLRSPGVHHLDIEPLSMLKFTKHHSPSNSKNFISPNSRPSLQHFNSHSKRVLNQYNLEEHWIQTQVENMDLTEDGACIYHNNGEIWAKHVLLAIGNGNQLHIPEWARLLKARSFPVHHIYSPEFSIKNYTPGFHTTVVGSGMGAVQVFIKLAETYSKPITLLTPGELTVDQYDIEPGWMGPKYLTQFKQTKCWQQRRSMINSARKGGTITPDVHWELKQVLTKKHATHIICPVKGSEFFGSDSACMNLSDNTSILSDQILLGTGFSPVINSDLIQKLVSKPELKCAECGYPIVDTFLRWHPNLLVSGELAELEVGPAAKNIIGARHAGQRIKHLF